MAFVPPLATSQEAPQSAIDDLVYTLIMIAYLAPAGGQAGLMDELDEAQARERRRQRWLHNYGAPRGDRWDYLVDDQVERMVKGCIPMSRTS